MSDVDGQMAGQTDDAVTMAAGAGSGVGAGAAAAASAWR